MTGALLAAARRGVRVRVLTPGKIDHNLARSASRRDYGALGGVEIFEYQASLLHAKTMVVDGAWATVGSTNFDNRSFAMNDELNVGIHDRAIARGLEELFEQNLRRARRIDYERPQGAPDGGAGAAGPGPPLIVRTPYSTPASAITRRMRSAARSGSPSRPAASIRRNCSARCTTERALSSPPTIRKCDWWPLR